MSGNIDTGIEWVSPRESCGLQRPWTAIGLVVTPRADGVMVLLVIENYLTNRERRDFKTLVIEWHQSYLTDPSSNIIWDLGIKNYQIASGTLPRPQPYTM